jgi:hypothetical protein
MNSKCGRCGAPAPHPDHVCVTNLQAKIIDIAESSRQLRLKLSEITDAARPFLVDDMTCLDDVGLGGEIWQCNHCGAYANLPESVEHHGGCIAERLRQAIFAAEKVLP